MEQVKTTEFSLCPKFEKAFAILGKKWNGLIIDVLLENGPQRFGELRQKIPELSDRVLVERLKELEGEGVISKAVRCDESSRLEYFLTDKGKDLQQAMEQIQQWAEKWVTAEECS
ncbi:winged helix-turn-helix transcriptional regulator [Enterococcus termitis]|jgi:DNA-binding HxlR family transcriptional regulator|uniref:HxlR family transcriptional regulator n=1 Tax=Enterococcus termitis TaxID=332950 RepID=A0A1E5G7M5_9ENTE|nr:helix-turn-helix domain-containing protein [Enterococcus termitis]OEG08714.1 HxlR family transcriptional regulator [Enterococcus termitis]OJG98187.1 transcriptional regulator [Enterococcus termitis]